MERTEDAVLQMDKAETAAFLKETFDYMTAIRTDPAVLRYEVLEAGAEPIGLLAEDDEGDVELYGKRYTRYKYFA